MASVIVPLGGNGFITKREDADSAEMITDEGLLNWAASGTVCSIFFRLSEPEVFDVSLRLRVPERESRIRVSIGDLQSYEVTVQGVEYYIRNIGTFFANSEGYVKIELRGIERAGEAFGIVSHLILTSIRGTVQQVAEAKDFYFGRRGPSVHLQYHPATGTGPIQYFYNELEVPFGQDVNGAYFMSAGFNGGYFGIQVNSEPGEEQERRVLFSIWSEFDADDPEDIPEEYRVQLLRKGSDVEVNDFGDEGSGKQSILRYNWSSGVVYKFLVCGSPIDEDNTAYTAWFSKPETSDWELIASFRKPKVSTHLAGLYSFSENFVPEAGWIERRALFGNQWVFSESNLGGFWTEITRCTFTGDATSESSRGDYAGGGNGTQFFLRNCGFFSDQVERNQEFTRETGNQPPDIDIPNLP